MRFHFKRVALTVACLLTLQCIVLWPQSVLPQKQLIALYQLSENQSLPEKQVFFDSLTCEENNEVVGNDDNILQSITSRSSQCFSDVSTDYIFRSYAAGASLRHGGSTENILCLSTQTSVDNLFWVGEQVVTWHGPISVAVFVPDIDFTIALVMIQSLRGCIAEVKRNVDWHLLYPKNMPPAIEKWEDLSCNCSSLEICNRETVDSFRSESFKKIMTQTKYPQNLLRNIARYFGSSEYFFTPDVDMLSSPGLHRQIINFVGRESTDNCHKCAYIIPTYEIKSGEVNPETKSELLEYLKIKKAQRFHWSVFAQNQANSKLQQWEKSFIPNVDLNVLYNITTYEEYWEPLYFSKRTSLPKFDERFIGYGSTRNTQVMEMEAANYSWHMLDQAFLTHRDFQSTKTRSRSRKRQLLENGRKYAVFRRELLKRYKIRQNDPRFAIKKRVKKKKKD